MSTITQRVTLKSPKMSNNYDKQSNYTLIDVFRPTKATFADSKVINNDFPTEFLPTCISLNVNFSIPTKNLDRFSHSLALLINHLV